MRALARQMERIGNLARNAKLFLVATALSGLGSGMFMLFLNLFVLARGNDATFLGLLTSLTSLATLGLGIPMGVLADRLGPKRSLLFGWLMSTVGVLVVVLSPWDWPLMAGAVAYFVPLSPSRLRRCLFF